jgi:hypothetical protein
MRWTSPRSGALLRLVGPVRCCLSGNLGVAGERRPCWSRGRCGSGAPFVTRRGRTGARCTLHSRAARAASSIDAFVEQLSSDGVSALHFLINNAGVLNPPFAKVRHALSL